MTDLHPRFLFVLASLLFAPFFLATGTFTSFSAFAQVADTTRLAPPDSAAVVAPDSTVSLPQNAPPQREVVVKPHIPFLDDNAGVIVNDTLPARHPALDPAGILEETPGAFLYDFGASGWPDGWSPFGITAQDVALRFNHIPFNNSVTGTPELELLPFSMLQPLRLKAGDLGTSVGINTRLRGFDFSRPLTEIRYRQSNNGLKSVMVFHSQQRSIPLAKMQGILGITLAYGGHGANGEYPGSKLEGGRQLLTRLRYRHPWGSVELLNFTNRRRLGAHGGVQPIGTSYETIYNRFGASVLNTDAQRQSLRNDLALTVRTQVLPDSAHPLTAMTYWTAGTYRYVLRDTLQARTSRFGYRISQVFSLGAGNLTVALEGWNESLRNNSNALPDSLSPSRSALHLSANLSLPLDALQLEVEPALHKTDWGSFIGGQSRLTLDRDWLKVFVQTAYAGQAPSWVHLHGWGGSVDPLDTNPEARTLAMQAGLSLTGGPFSLDLTGFTSRTTSYTDFFAIPNATTTSTDSIAAQLFEDPVQWVGATVDVGFRKKAARGFYLSFAPTLYKLGNATVSANHSVLTGSLPELFLQGRAGLRYLIFQGDLDLDLYANMRAWSSFQSRTLHPQTGLLALRTVDSRPVDESIALDVVLEAGIRTAKLFLSFENVLSHPSLLVGNLLVPDYPLPAQRFRFGVFWPIQD